MKYPTELVARIKAGCLFMDAKIVARCVGVPLGTVQSICNGKRRTEVEPDRKVVEALERIVRGIPA